jgi:DNA-binding NtrC family response regulator
MTLNEIGRQGTHSESFSERDILYKVLFDMRKDMTDLKQMVLQLAKGGIDGAAVLETHKALFEDVESAPATPASVPTSFNQNPVTRPEPLLLNQPQEEDLDEEFATQDIEHDLEEENLSLERKEKELILKALTRNGSKRKQAAYELGISERTLYRKIKQYAIE